MCCIRAAQIQNMEEAHRKLEATRTALQEAYDDLHIVKVGRSQSSTHISLQPWKCCCLCCVRLGPPCREQRGRVKRSNRDQATPRDRLFEGYHELFEPDQNFRKHPTLTGYPAHRSHAFMKCNSGEQRGQRESSGIGLSRAQKQRQSGSKSLSGIL